MTSLLLFALCGAAGATDVDSYLPAGSTFAGQGGLQVAVPTIGVGGTVSLGLQGTYAHDPLVQRWSDGAQEALVSTLVGTRFLAGYTLKGGYRIDLDAPLYPYLAQPQAGTAGFSMGDVRLGALVPFQADPGVAVGFLPSISLPTGSSSTGGALTGAGGVTGTLAVAASGDVTKSVRITGNLGAMLQAPEVVENTTLGSELRAGLAAAWKPTSGAEVGAELTGTADLADGFGGAGQLPVEAHVYGTWTAASGFVATVGGGTGILAGVGSPQARVILGLGWRSAGSARARDADGDHLMDADDRCVDTAEDLDGFEDADGCPDPDNDADGVLDGADACPTDAEDKDAFDDADGCPDPDNDKDGVLDGGDACPTVAGSARTGGCPDADGDGLADAMDRCPAEAGPLTTSGCPDSDEDRVPDDLDKCPNDPVEPERVTQGDGKSDGCPEVHVDKSAGRIDVRGTIYFDTGTARIQEESHALLDRIAKVLVAHPELTRVEIGGHTDSEGDDRGNMRLSQKRAEAVVDYLVTRGVGRSRLVAKGYGETLPLETNMTESGRAKNRRVEFRILPPR